MHHFKLILILVFVTFFSLVSFAGEPDQELHLKCIYPTVLVADAVEQGNGSGVIVRSEKIEDGLYMNVALTCEHVTSEIKNPRVYIIKYKNWSQVDKNSVKIMSAKVYAADKFLDIAILVFATDCEMPTANMGLDENLYLGNDIVSVGCALGSLPRIEFGKVTGVTDRKLRASILTIPGDSGGPVYHNYKLVALKQAVRTYKDHIVFHFSENIILAQMKKWNEKTWVSFAYDAKETLPVLPTLFFKADRFKKIDVNHSYGQDQFPELDTFHGNFEK